MPSMTITTDNGQGTRLAASIGRRIDARDNGVPRPATAAEIKAFTIAYLRAVVLDDEAEQRRRNDQPVAFDPT